MRTTILFALPAKDMGGTERVVLNLLRNIDTKRFEIHLTTLAAAGITCGDIPAYVEVHEFGVGRARWAMLPIAKLCWKLKPDIVFSMSAHLNSVIIASRTLMGRDIRIFV